MEMTTWLHPARGNRRFDPDLVSFVEGNSGIYMECKSLAESIRFYEGLLGCKLIERTSSFDFKEARMSHGPRWLSPYLGDLYLREYGSCGRQDQDEQQGDDTRTTSTPKTDVHPKDKPISFQCSDIELLIRRLKERRIPYDTNTVEEGGVTFDQLLFHDPDGYKIEIRSSSPERRGSSKPGGHWPWNLKRTRGHACRPKQNNKGFEAMLLDSGRVGF